MKYLISYLFSNISSKHFIKKFFALIGSRLLISISIIPPHISLTIGALSLLFNTIPIKSCLNLFGFVSYLLPTYFFLHNIKNGQNVFSYAKLCGNGKYVLINSPDIFPISIDKSNERLSVILFPPL